jgi:hypothetical protein
VTRPASLHHSANSQWPVAVFGRASFRVVLLLHIGANDDARDLCRRELAGPRSVLS